MPVPLLINSNACIWLPSNVFIIKLPFTTLMPAFQFLCSPILCILSLLCLKSLTTSSTATLWESYKGWRIDRDERARQKKKLFTFALNSVTVSELREVWLKNKRFKGFRNEKRDENGAAFWLYPTRWTAAFVKLQCNHDWPQRVHTVTDTTNFLSLCAFVDFVNNLHPLTVILKDLS